MASTGFRAVCLCGMVFLCAHVLHAADAYIYTEAPRYEPRAAERFPAGAILRLVAAGGTRPLAPGFASTADAEVSYDARRVLFAGKRAPGDPWRIWEAALDGTPPKLVVASATDAVRPLYLPGDRIAYAVRTSRGFQIETIGAAGSAPLRLTHAPGDHLPCGVLRDGRILFMGPHPEAASGADLFRFYTDGSGVETVRCDHARPARAGREFSSGDIVYESAGRLFRFTSALARGIEIDLPGGEFAGPAAEAGGAWLVAYRRDPAGRFGIHRRALKGGALEPLAMPAAVHAVEPVAVAPRPPAKRHPSSLGKREGANVLCLNVYDSPLPLPAGAVRQVRVWARGEEGTPAALGEAPVEADGSFFVNVPGDRPLRFELLDGAGKSVAAERGWYWLRRGEQRVCVGCHAGPERAPENRTPAVLLRTSQPVPIPPATAKGGDTR